MASHAAVGRGDDLAGAFAPGGDHPIDRLRRHIGTVGEDDDCSSRVGCEGRKAAPERRPRARLPVRAGNDPGCGIELVCACDHDQPAELGAAREPVEHRLDQELLFRRAESRRRPRREYDCRYGII